MMKDFLTSVRLVALSVVVCCGVYPLLIFAFARLVVPEKSQGSLLRNRDGAVIGSRLLAQEFGQDKYFWPRPSAVQYNASATGGSNLSPVDPRITERAREIVGRFALPPGEQLPAELVTASGSGLDPHLTLAAANSQLSRVAAARKIAEDPLAALIERHALAPPFTTEKRQRLVNVLELNIDLDRHFPLE